MEEFARNPKDPNYYFKKLKKSINESNWIKEIKKKSDNC